MQTIAAVVCYKSLCGWLKIVASEKGITQVTFVDRPSEPNGANVFLTECIKQLEEYFGKKRNSFSVPLDLSGTDFQKKVWHELLKIPWGTTISYTELALNLGDKKVIRAAGTANGKNPVAIIVPCHRVIGAHGDLVGYSGGMDNKKWLLAHEGSFTQLSLF